MSKSYIISETFWTPVPSMQSASADLMGLVSQLTAEWKFKAPSRVTVRVVTQMVVIIMITIGSSTILPIMFHTQREGSLTMKKLKPLEWYT